MQQFISVKAFIINDGKILILRESKNYKEGANIGSYQIPGGRLELGEHFEDGLKREVREETRLEVEIGKPFHVGEWRPTIKGIECQIVGIFFECIPQSLDVVLSEDHDDFLWIKPEEHEKYPMASGTRKAFDQFLEDKRIKL